MENTATEGSVSVETKIFTASGNSFTVPMSYEDTMKEIQEGNGIITIKRYAVVQRIITNPNGEHTQVASNAKITTRLDTNVDKIAAIEETHMTDVVSVNSETGDEV